MKLKEFGCPGGGMRPHAPLRFANAFVFLTSIIGPSSGDQRCDPSDGTTPQNTHWYPSVGTDGQVGNH